VVVLIGINSSGKVGEHPQPWIYIACIQRYYVLDDYTAELVDGFENRVADPPTCG
jgi:hypothetical protein